MKQIPERHRSTRQLARRFEYVASAAAVDLCRAILEPDILIARMHENAAASLLIERNEIEALLIARLQKRMRRKS